MRRYRILNPTFDNRGHFLTEAIETGWDPIVQAQHWSARVGVLRELQHTYGAADFERKVVDYLALGPKPFSIVAYQNEFFQQARDAFVFGTYYPALTAVTALGERILNHLVLQLRDSYKSTPDYKRVASKKSFDNWDPVIDILRTWNVLTRDVASDFTKLKGLRNDAIHYRQHLDRDSRPPALEAIQLMNSIVEGQFGAIPPKPWFIEGTADPYIKQDAESDPFVRNVLLKSPCAVLVGPWHELIYDDHSGGFKVADIGDAGPVTGSDEEFLRWRSTPRQPTQEARVADNVHDVSAEVKPTPSS